MREREVIRYKNQLFLREYKGQTMNIRSFSALRKKDLDGLICQVSYCSRYIKCEKINDFFVENSRIQQERYD